MRHKGCGGDVETDFSWQGENDDGVGEYEITLYCERCGETYHYIDFE